MKTKHKLKLMSMVINMASLENNEDWYTKDIIYSYKKLYKAIIK